MQIAILLYPGMTAIGGYNVNYSLGDLVAAFFALSY